MQRLENKKIIIMGGTSGIGKAIVEKFSAQGAQIVFCGRSATKGDEIEKSITNSKFIVCDVTQKDSINNFFEQALAHLGNFDCAVNNAGISGAMCSFHETEDHHLEDIMRTNFFGTWYFLKKEIQFLLQNNQAGSIVNMASTSGFIGNGLGLAPYCASKHAVVGLTKSVALEYAKKQIRVNAICPGFVDTPMTDQADDYSPKFRRRIAALHPLGRIATTDEVANAALFLCSDESAFVTGSSLVIDGGLTT